MRKLILLLIVTCAACGLGACASKNKPSAHIYDGDAPTIRMAPSKRWRPAERVLSVPQERLIEDGDLGEQFGPPAASLSL